MTRPPGIPSRERHSFPEGLVVPGFWVSWGFLIGLLVGAFLL